MTAAARPRVSFEERNAQIGEFIQQAVKPPLTPKSENDIVLIITDYLFSTVFPSIRLFIHYCRHNDSIELRAKRPLVIHGASLIYHNDTEEEIPWQKKHSMAREYYIFDALISPLGKGFSRTFHAPDERCVSNFSKGTFSFSSTVDATWTIEKTPLNLRLSDLLRMMIASSIYKVDFEEEVRFWGLTNREYEAFIEGGSKQFPGRVIERVSPAILQVDPSYPAIEGISRTNSGVTGRGTAYPQGIKISLEMKSTLSNIRTFLEQISLFGSMYIPANREFEIRDSQIGSIVETYNTEVAGTENRAQFVFEQMVLPLGKGILIHAPSATSWTFHQVTKEDAVSIRSNEELELRLVTKDLHTTLKQLGTSMMLNGWTALPLTPGQSLFLYGLSPEERDLKKSSNMDERFSKHRLPGTQWAFFASKGMNVRETTLKTASQTWPVLEMTSSPYLVVLARSSGETLISDILKSFPHLGPSLIENRDPEAFHFLGFLVMAVCCFNGLPFFSKVGIPQGFSAKTYEKINELWKDEVFMKARGLILQSRDLSEQFNRLCTEASPQNFDQMDKESLPEPVKIVFEKLKALAWAILQGSPLFSQFLPKYFEQQRPAAAQTAAQDVKNSKCMDCVIS